MPAPRLLFIAAFCLLMQGCVTSATSAVSASDALPDFGDISRFGPRPEIPTPTAVHQLTPEQKADFPGYYHRALDVAPYLHEAYLGLALSYYAAGRLRNAELALIDAAGSANRVSARTLYEAKLATLRKEF